MSRMKKQIAELQVTIERLSQERQQWYIRATFLEGKVAELGRQLETALLENDGIDDVVEVVPIFPAPIRSQ